MRCLKNKTLELPQTTPSPVLNQNTTQAETMCRH